MNVQHIVTRLLNDAKGRALTADEFDALMACEDSEAITLAYMGSIGNTPEQYDQLKRRVRELQAARRK